jgi:hypothetical protein
MQKCLILHKHTYRTERYGGYGYQTLDACVIMILGFLDDFEFAQIFVYDEIHFYNCHG